MKSNWFTKYLSSTYALLGTNFVITRLALEYLTVTLNAQDLLQQCNEMRISIRVPLWDSCAVQEFL